MTTPTVACRHCDGTGVIEGPLRANQSWQYPHGWPDWDEKPCRECKGGRVEWDEYYETLDEAREDASFEDRRW